MSFYMFCMGSKKYVPINVAHKLNKSYTSIIISSFLTVMIKPAIYGFVDHSYHLTLDIPSSIDNEFFYFVWFTCLSTKT